MVQTERSEVFIVVELAFAQKGSIECVISTAGRNLTLRKGLKFRLHRFGEISPYGRNDGIVQLVPHFL